MNSSTHEHLPPPLADSKLFPLGRTAPPRAGNYKWVYLWGAPLRAMHWIAAIAIVVLIATGFYIGKPYFLGRGEASPGFLMGYVRFAHFIAAGVLVMTGIVRLYWLLAGNQFERLPALFPIRSRDFTNLVRQVKYYLMIQPEKAPHYLGHNPIQQLSYTFTYLVGVLMVATGFTMYGQANPGGFFYTLTAPVASLLGGLQVVRFLHHTATWWFVIFPIMHIYLAVRADIMERGGGLSSIFSGGHFVRADRDYVDE